MQAFYSVIKIRKGCFIRLVSQSFWPCDYDYDYEPSCFNGVSDLK